jgi:hypothetical protein
MYRATEKTWDAGGESSPPLLPHADETAVSTGEKPLTFRRELRRFECFSSIAPSSNGKTADSGSVYRGSNPCGAAVHCERGNAK